MTRILTVTADCQDTDERVDRFLAARLPDLSRARIQALLGAGEVQCDGAVIAEASARVKPGQHFCLSVPSPRPALPAPQAIPLDVLFEDEHLVVLVKPAGLVVHPAPGHADGTLVNALLAHCRGSLSGIGGVLRPGIVHRLDKDVSGVMVVAKHDQAHRGLAGQFSLHCIERAYQAIVLGVPPATSGTIEQPIGRHPRQRLRMAVVPGGKRAVTRYRLLAAAGRLGARLELELGTGRTHQIRVHLATLGLGIVGDVVYGRKPGVALSPALRAELAGFGRIALHAWRLGFEHPVSGRTLRFEQPPPASFEHLFEQLLAEFNTVAGVNRPYTVR